MNILFHRSEKSKVLIEKVNLASFAYFLPAAQDVILILPAVIVYLFSQKGLRGEGFHVQTCSGGQEGQI